MLPADALKERLAVLPAWKLSADGTAIRREFVARNWNAAMTFFNAVRLLSCVDTIFLATALRMAFKATFHFVDCR